jgi:hypothetical protein
MYEEMVGADGALHEQREPFIKFWTLLKRSHPVQACRAGARTMLANLDTWWPKDQQSNGVLHTPVSYLTSCLCPYCMHVQLPAYATYRVHFTSM